MRPSSELAQRFDQLTRDYRIVPTPDGYALEYKEPAKRQWVEVYDGLSVLGCVRAYEQLADGEQPTLSTCESAEL